MNKLLKAGDGDLDRRAAFDSDMSPDEIQKFGIKNRLPKNVIYNVREVSLITPSSNIFLQYL